jgi:hypothetical protein
MRHDRRVTTFSPTTSTTLAALRASFAPVPGYLNAATLGLPTRETVAALTTALADWQGGQASPVDYDEAVRRSRQAYARLVDVPLADVAVGSQASAMVGMVAGSLHGC